MTSTQPGSPFAKFGPLPLQQVRINDSFWRARQTTNRQVSLPSQYDEIERTGRFDNFRRAIGEKDGDYKHLAADSDVFKWMEGLALSLATHPDEKLEAMLDEAIDLAARAQDEDGYLNTAFEREKIAERWTNLHRSHELYNGGHLIQAAVAHFRATGKTTFLDVATKWADLVCQLFGESNPATDGHPEVELALVELSRATGERRYLEQAQFFVEQRGHKPSVLKGEAEQQDHKPIREQTTVRGHAVRQFYLASGVADIAMETGEAALIETLQKQWDDFSACKMHVTGGSGVMRKGEGFGEAFELPNRTAYDETCAAIAAGMWHHRMLRLTGEARFADAMELSFYNGALAGVAQSGDAYFYTNVLEHDGGADLLSAGRGSCRRTRVHWDNTACCPPNVARLVAGFGAYIYGQSQSALWIHLFVAGSARTELNGTPVTLTQTHDFPWDGHIELEVEPEHDGLEFELKVRIPGWAGGAALQLNDEEVRSVEAGTYISIGRTWARGDKVRLELPMETRRLRAHPRVTDNAGSVALRRGALIYCLEQADQPGEDLFLLALPKHAPIQARREEILGGLVALHARGVRRAAPSSLYGEDEPSSTEGVPLKFIPYCLWTNREPGAMRVWVPEI